MTKKIKNRSPSVNFPIVNTRAAGIDIGSKSNWVSIGTSRESIREYGVFTEDHHALAKWLKSNKVETVAMESTGIYWKPLFLILQSYGFEVILVNAAHIKNVRGKKSDVLDCQWIWQLHSAGLLHGSFQPDFFTAELRTYNRQRKNLIEDAARHISRMQKALILMNIQLPVVLTDITGKSGKAIIKAIIEGERDSKKLACLADGRVKADRVTIAKALTGTWQSQFLFTLEQSWNMYQSYQKQISSCDNKIDQLLKDKVASTGQNDLVYQPEKKSPGAKMLQKQKLKNIAFN